jgi:ABC-type multidrug transport system ATPase subunit
MAFLRQWYALVEKTLLIVFWRNWFSTLVRAFFAPIIFFFFIAYAKNFFVPPSEFGVGSPYPVRSLADAVSHGSGGRSNFVFVNNGFSGGQISEIITPISDQLSGAGLKVQTVESEGELLTVCRSSIRSVSNCFGAVTFVSSPTEGSGGIWNYTLRADGSLGGRVFVDRDTNDNEIYILPIQHAIDRQIALLEGATLPEDVQTLAYTSKTNEERDANITRLYMDSIINILGLAYFIGIVGVAYQLTGQLAQERELGMSQLIEAMMPNKRRWEPQAARILSTHFSFSVLYLPAWIIGAAIVSSLNYPDSPIGVLVGYYIMGGLALTSFSIAFASLFSKAQLSGITVTIVSIILAIIIQVVPPSGDGVVYILSLLFPPMNFTLFTIYMAYWQQEEVPVDLSQGPPGSPWQVPGYVFFIFSAIQILVYPLVGAWIERSLYGTASKARTLRHVADGSPETVKITGLKKYYPQSWIYRNLWARFSKDPRQIVKAVDDIDITVLRGQVMILLGSNGSGKSTTLDVLAGLQKPTEGTIEMEAAGGIGLCPQKNVLWDELTVYEHVKIFNRLKATTIDPKDTMKQLIADCDLEQKVNAKSSTLSGGQKRKCQLAMMLTGGSSLCMLDEVSSGLDPLSRRKIWDIILAERGRRSMILTTHFLDEADLLSDDVMIISKGKVVAHGSSVALKHELGGGYRVRIYHENKRELPAEMEQYPKDVQRDQTVYQLADSATAAYFVLELEKHGIVDYQVNGPQLEDVFLNLAGETMEEFAKIKEEDGSPVSSSENVTPRRKELQLAKGKNLGFAAQTWVLFQKRWIILRRNPLPYLVALLIPIIAGGLVTLFVQGYETPSCRPEDNASNSPSFSAQSLLLLDRVDRFAAGPSADLPSQLLDTIYPGLTYESIDSVQGLVDFVSANYRNATPGAFVLGNTPTFAWRGDYDVYYSVAVQNIMDVSLSGTPIFTSFQHFDTQRAPGLGQTLQFILYFGLAMSAYPGFFALYTNIERLRTVRALHYSNGVRAGPLWIAYTLFDFCIVLLVSAVTVIIYVASAPAAFYGIGYVFLVFMLYGLSATLMAYVVSLFTTSQLATFAFASGGQCCFFLIYFVVFMVLNTFIDPAEIDRSVDISHYVIAAIFPSGNLFRTLTTTLNIFSITCKDTRIAPYPGDISVYGACILYLILQSVIFLIVLIWWDSGYKPAFLTRKQHREQDAEETEAVDPEVFAEAKRVDSSNDELRVLHASKIFGNNVAVNDITFGVPRGEVFALLGPNGAGKSTTMNMIRGDARPTGRSSDIRIEDRSIIAQRAAARTNLGVCPQHDAMDQMTAVEHLRFYARARGVPNVEDNVAQIIHAVGLEPFKTRMAAKLSGGNKRKLSLGISLIGNPSVVLLDEPSSGMDAASKRIMWRTLQSVSAGRSLVLTTHSMEEADALAHRAGIMARHMLALGTADQLRKKHSDAMHVHLVHKDAPYTSEKDMAEIKNFVVSTFPGAHTEDRSFHGQFRFSCPAAMADSVENDSIDGSNGSVSKGGAIEKERTIGTPRSGISSLFAQLEANKQSLGLEYYSVSQATLDQVFLSIVGKHNVQEENYAAQHQPEKKSRWKRLIGNAGKPKDVVGQLTVAT